MPSLPPIRPRQTVGIDAEGRPVLFEQSFMRWLEELQRSHVALQAENSDLEARIITLEASIALPANLERRVSDLEAGITVWTPYDPEA